MSTRGQVKSGASIPDQDREIRTWARRDGHRIVGMFPEEGRSGALDLEDRAALTAAINLIAIGKAEGLACYSLDRLAREITVQESILAKLREEAGGQVFTTDHGEVQSDDSDDPTWAVPVGIVARIVTGRSETRANQAVCGATQAEGRSECEIRRCLKHTVARQLFRLTGLQAPTRVTALTASRVSAEACSAREAVGIQSIYQRPAAVGDPDGAAANGQLSQGGLQAHA